MIAAPLSGWLRVSCAIRRPASSACSGGTAHRPITADGADKTSSGTEYALPLHAAPVSYLGMCLWVLHIVAALYHHFWRRDRGACCRGRQPPPGAKRCYPHQPSRHVERSMRWIAAALLAYAAPEKQRRTPIASTQPYAPLSFEVDHFERPLSSWCGDCSKPPAAHHALDRERGTGRPLTCRSNCRGIELSHDKCNQIVVGEKNPRLEWPDAEHYPTAEDPARSGTWRARRPRSRASSRCAV